MKLLVRLSLIVIAVVLGACAHPINISPKIDFSDAGDPSVRKSVAYVIRQEDRDREVTTAGGGGDMVSYFPYRDLESGIFQALNAIFSRVTLVRKIDDGPTLSKNNISLVVLPKITTSSSSDGLFTWPPTQFSITIEYQVQDTAGALVYKNLTMGNGRATFSEFSEAGDFGLAGRRAAEDVLKKLKEQISGAKELTAQLAPQPTDLPKETPRDQSAAYKKLRELDALRKDGVLTQEEFDAKKAEILKGM